MDDFNFGWTTGDVLQNIFFNPSEPIQKVGPIARVIYT